MSLSALEIENRIGALLEQRMNDSGQLNGLDDEQLAGIGKSLKKVAKKVGKVVKKVAPIALGAGALYLGAKAVSNVIASPTKKQAKAEKKAAKKAAKVTAQAAKLGLAVAPAVAQVALASSAPPPVAAAVSSGEAAQALQQAVQSGALPPSTGTGSGVASQLIDTAGQIATAVMASQGLPSAASDPQIQQITRDAIAAEMPQYMQQQYMPSSSYGGGGGYVSSSPKSAPGGQIDMELPEMTVLGKKLHPWLLPGAIAAGLGLLLVMNNNRRA